MGKLDLDALNVWLAADARTDTSARGLVWRTTLRALVARVRELEAVAQAARAYIEADKLAMRLVNECESHWGTENEEEGKDCNEAPCGRAMHAEYEAKVALAAALDALAAKDGGRG